MLLWGVWFGPEKPKMDTFLTPFVQDMKALRDDGKFFYCTRKVVLGEGGSSLISNLTAVASCNFNLSDASDYNFYIS